MFVVWRLTGIVAQKGHFRSLPSPSRVNPNTVGRSGFTIAEQTLELCQWNGEMVIQVKNKQLMEKLAPGAHRCADSQRQNRTQDFARLFSCLMSRSIACVSR